MNNIFKWTLGALAGLYAVTTPLGIYQLDKTENAAEERLGGIVATENTPGPHLVDRWYVPGFGILTDVVRRDKRIREYEDSSEDIPTKDRKLIRSNRFVKWRIEDPKKYIPRVGNEKKAKEILDGKVFDKVWAGIGSHTFEENQNTKREKIRLEMVAEADQLMDRAGIEIIDLRIKRTDIPYQSRVQIHRRMWSEFDKKATETRAEGTRKSKEILGDRDREVARIRSEADGEILKIHGDADRAIGNMFEEIYNLDPDFYRFYEEMETANLLAESSPTLVLSSDTPWLDRVVKGGAAPEVKIRKAKGKKARPEPTASAPAVPMPDPAEPAGPLPQPLPQPLPEQPDGE